MAGALGPVALRIDHHGSTAVPGLAAKPVIDIQVSVRRLQPIEAYGAALAQLGYTDRGLAAGLPRGFPAAGERRS
jgi:GrpB-like predicted nucleotidyltransferase (UPF0157 family)